MRLVRCHAIIMTMSELVDNIRLHVGNKAPSVQSTDYKVPLFTVHSAYGAPYLLHSGLSVVWLYGLILVSVCYVNTPVWYLQIYSEMHILT